MPTPYRLRRSLHACACLCLIAALAGGLDASAPLSDDDWPEFRGPNHAGVADGANLPSQFDGVGGEHVAWKTPIPGLAHSSPIVVGDVVYLTTAVPIEDRETELVTGDVNVAGIAAASDQVPHSWRLYALDLDSGEVLWHRVAKEGTPRVKRHVKASHASATPASDGERIVVLFGSEGMYTYDLEGNLLWSRDVGLLNQGLWGDPDYEWGPASSPVIHDGLVIFQNDRQADSELIAFRIEDGEEVWRVARNEKPSWATPTLVREPRLELVVNGANWLTAYDPADGTELWRFSNDDKQVITPTPVAHDDQVVITGGYPAGGNPIRLIRAGGSGDITGAADQLVWEIERGSPYTPTPIIYDGLLYSVTDNGILSVFDMGSGERLYRERLSVGAGYTASPVASDNRIYFPSEDGDVMVIEAGREYSLIAQNAMGEVLMASPAIAGNTMVVRGVSHVFGIRAD